MKNIKEFRKVYYDIERKVRNKKRICAYPECTMNTIPSHNISESFLALIAEQGKVRKFGVHPYKGLEFERVGIRLATIFAGFCSAHDNLLFSSIDNINVDLSNPINLHLFNYRATIQEKVFKINKSETYKESSTRFTKYDYPLISHYNGRVKEYKFNNEVDNWYSNELLSCINTGENNFFFEFIELPYQDVIASELITFEPSEISALKRSLFDNFLFVEPFSNLYVHIIPNSQKRHSTLVLSMHKKDKEVLAYLFNYFNTMSLDKLLSDLLLLYLELWVCSETFYYQYLFPRKDMINGLFSNTNSNAAIERETELNLFHS